MREETGDKLVFVCPSHHTQKCDSTSLTSQIVTRNHRPGFYLGRGEAEDCTKPSSTTTLRVGNTREGTAKGYKESSSFWGLLAIRA